MLHYIENTIQQGQISKVTNSNAYRYRLHNKTGIEILINCVNGHIRNSVRLNQFKNVLTIINIPLIQPIPLTKESNWFAGFFDADGSIFINKNKKYANVTITVRNKYYNDLVEFKNVFNGDVYYDKSLKGSFRWVIQSKNDISEFYDYYKNSTFLSTKSNRFKLIDEYRELIKIKAYLPTNSRYSDYENLIIKWNKLKI